MRYFQLSQMALLSIIIVVSSMVGCTPASGDEDYEHKYEMLKIENTVLNANMETAKADIIYLRSALEESKAEYDTENNEYDALEAEHSTLKATSKKLQADYNTLRTDYDSLKADSILYDTALTAQIADYNSLKTNYDSLRALYDELFEFVQTEMSGSNPLPTYPTPTLTYTTWIDEYEATYGELPVVPDWMLDLMPELEAGDRIRKDVIFIGASAQYWSLRSPSQKEMILETVSWLGNNPVDYEWSIYH